MKREIKFRAKTLANSHWVVGSYIHDEECPTIRAFGGGEPLVDPYTVGQYTGLKDVNGKEIYEGDIIRFHTGATYVVTFEPGRFIGIRGVAKEPKRYLRGAQWMRHLYRTEQFANILGNVHDNPQLLKGGEE